MTNYKTLEESPWNRYKAPGKHSFTERERQEIAKLTAEPKQAAAYMRFLELTGPLPKQDAGDVLQKVTPAINSGFFGPFQTFLDSMQGKARLRNLVKEYDRGKVSPELAAILKQDPGEWPLDRLDFDFYRPDTEVIKSWELDFSPFRGPDDTGEGWFLKYRLAFEPLPIIRRTIDEIRDTNEANYAIDRDYLKAQTTLLLRGTKKEQTGQEYVRPPVPAAEILLFVEAVEAQHRARKQERTPRGYLAPLSGPAAAGFYINPETREIKDLRPFSKELHALLSVDSWDYLQDFSESVRGAVQEHLEQERQQGIFKEEKFIKLKNTPETMAIATLTSGITEIYEQPALPGLDGMAEYSTEIMIRKGDAERGTGTLKLKIKEKPKGPGLRSRTQKLKTLLEALYTQRRNPCYSFSVREYMQLCKPNRNSDYYEGANLWKFAAKLRADLQALYNVSFTVNYPGLPAGEIRILDGWTPGPNGTVEISMGAVYCKNLLAKGGLSQICRTFFQTDERNPHAVPFLLKLCNNRTNPDNIAMEQKGNRRAHRISLKALYEYDSQNFPPLEKVKRNRKYKELIMDPIVKTIAQLNDEGHIISRYVNPDGKEYTAGDLANASFAEFMDKKRWLLEYEVTGFDDKLITPADVPEPDDKPAKKPKRKRPKNEKK